MLVRPSSLFLEWLDCMCSESQSWALRSPTHSRQKSELVNMPEISTRVGNSPQSEYRLLDACVSTGTCNVAEICSQTCYRECSVS